MKFHIRFAHRVAKDWERLRREIDLASGNEHVVQAYETRIRRACLSLAQHPERFPVWRFDPSVRVLPVAKYLIFFRVKKKTVFILHIRYAGRSPFKE